MFNLKAILSRVMVVVFSIVLITTFTGCYDNKGSVDPDTDVISNNEDLNDDTNNDSGDQSDDGNDSESFDGGTDFADNQGGQEEDLNVSYAVETYGFKYVLNAPFYEVSPYDLARLNIVEKEDYDIKFNRFKKKIMAAKNYFSWVELDVQNRFYPINKDITLIELSDALSFLKEQDLEVFLYFSSIHSPYDRENVESDFEYVRDAINKSESEAVFIIRPFLEGSRFSLQEGKYSEDKMHVFKDRVDFIRSYMPNSEIGYVGTFDEWMENRELVDLVDFVLLDLGNTYDDLWPEDAVSWIFQRYQQIEKIAGNKRVIIQSVRWKNNFFVDRERETDFNNKEYSFLLNFISWANKNNVKFSLERIFNESIYDSRGKFMGVSEGILGYYDLLTEGKKEILEGELLDKDWYKFALIPGEPPSIKISEFSERYANNGTHINVKGIVKNISVFDNKVIISHNIESPGTNYREWILNIPYENSPDSNILYTGEWVATANSYNRLRGEKSDFRSLRVYVVPKDYTLQLDRYNAEELNRVAIVYEEFYVH